MHRLSKGKLATHIRPAGYYNIKAKRLKEYLGYFIKKYKGDIQKMRAKDAGILRSELLSVKGFGPETADSILLYALDKPAFVVDAYTKRILSRHGFIKEDAKYEEAQSFFMTKPPWICDSRNRRLVTRGLGPGFPGGGAGPRNSHGLMLE